MSLIRKLNNGTWNKPPVLTAARLVFAKGLAEKYPPRELGDLADFVNGTSYDRGRLDMGDTPIIRISNITDPASDFIKTDEQFPERYHISQGDLLVSWSASFKSILWPGPDGILNQHIFKVTERNGHARSYIRHAIEAAFDEMRRNVVGMGMMHLRRSDFLGHRVPCPPPGIQCTVAEYLDWVEGGCDGKEPKLPKELSEQRRIVAKIESLATKIDEAHGLRTKSQAASRLIWRSGAAVILSGITGDLWQPLGDIVEISGGGTPSKSNPLFWGGDIPWVSPKDMKTPEIHSAEDFITEAGLTGSSTRLYEPGALLIVIRGMILAHTVPVAVLRVPATINQDMKALQPREGVDVEYLATVLRALNGHLLQQVDKSSHDTRKLVTPKLSAFRVPVPPVNEQRRIVGELEDLQTKVDRLKGLQQKTAAELDALLPSILDKAFKGEL